MCVLIIWYKKTIFFKNKQIITDVQFINLVTLIVGYMVP